MLKKTVTVSHFPETLARVKQQLLGGSRNSLFKQSLHVHLNAMYPMHTILWVALLNERHKLQHQYCNWLAYTKVGKARARSWSSYNIFLLSASMPLEGQQKDPDKWVVQKTLATREPADVTPLMPTDVWTQNKPEKNATQSVVWANCTPHRRRRRPCHLDGSSCPCCQNEMEGRLGRSSPTSFCLQSAPTAMSVHFNGWL